MAMQEKKLHEVLLSALPYFWGSETKYEKSNPFLETAKHLYHAGFSDDEILDLIALTLSAIIARSGPDKMHYFIKSLQIGCGDDGDARWMEATQGANP